MKKVIFITELRNPTTAKASSTTIMINNLLMGLSQTAECVHLVAFVDNITENQDFQNFYADKVKKISLFQSQLCNDGVQRKYKTLYKESISWFKKSEYRKYARKIEINNDDVIISHSPSIESVLLARELAIFQNRYIQFWSDPITISGIYPEKINIKRFPAYISERKALSYAGEVVYGTKILCDFQKKVFKKYSDKMRYVDICHSMPKDEGRKATLRKKLTFGYFGNYYSAIRNILPLYHAFLECENKLLICGTGDVKLASCGQIEVRERVSIEEADRLEDDVDVIVCILNRNCIQIPGKIFYKTHIQKDILIILDGKYKEEIQKYLKEFKRFVFCNNTVESIRECVTKFSAENLSYKLDESITISPLQMAQALLQERNNA